jgi:hypothetical protein
VRIGEPARRHGIADEDIEHAVRNAIRQYIESEFAILIGPATDGALLEIGILGIEATTRSSSMPCQPDPSSSSRGA